MFEQIEAEIKSAMLSKDTVKRDCLRTIVSDVKNATINANPPKLITDDAVIKVLQKSAKTHSDSIEQFKAAGRTDLVEKEQKELDILSSFLPTMLSEEETAKVVEKVLKDFGIEPFKKNMGLVMRNLPKVDGLDKKLVSKILQGILN